MGLEGKESSDDKRPSRKTGDRRPTQTVHLVNLGSQTSPPTSLCQTEDVEGLSPLTLSLSENWDSGSFEERVQTEKDGECREEKSSSGWQGGGDTLLPVAPDPIVDPAEDRHRSFERLRGREGQVTCTQKRDPTRVLSKSYPRLSPGLEF